jgi:hypothetical protein
MRGCSPAGVESGSTPSLPTTKKKVISSAKSHKIVDFSSIQD